MKDEIFDHEIAICRKHYPEGECNWGKCSECSVIPLLLKLRTGEIVED